MACKLRAGGWVRWQGHVACRQGGPEGSIKALRAQLSRVTTACCLKESEGEEEGEEGGEGEEEGEEEME